MKILLTGSSGFIGNVIVRKLITGTKHDITFLDKQRGFDARDFFRRDERYFDLVIHCAAVVGGRALIETSLAHAENLEIDAALFQWAERTKPGRIVYVSSVAAYPVGLQGMRRLLEEEQMGLEGWGKPDELYGMAKYMGEFLAARSSVPVSIPRPFTVYGEDQNPVFPFANILGQVRERRDPITVWGSGNQVRDFIHVEDIADGIIAMAKEGINGPVNFCTGRGVSLKYLTGMIAEAAGYSPEIETLTDKPQGLFYRVGNPERLNKFYTPKISLEEGIKRGLE